MTNIARSPSVRSTPTTIYAFAVILESLKQNGERQCLTAYFHEYPFHKEIDAWAQNLTGNNYRVIDSFPLEEISL